MHITTADDKIRVVVDGDLTVADAAALRNLLLEALAGSDHIEVDLRGVTGLDLSLMQMMCSAGRSARNLGKELFLTGTKGEAIMRARKEAGFIRSSGCNYNPTTSCLWVGGTE